MTGLWIVGRETSSIFDLCLSFLLFSLLAGAFWYYLSSVGERA